MKPSSVKCFALALGLLSSPIAIAAEVSVCPSLSELDNQLISCGDNYFASELARECADKINSSWRTAADQLKATLESSGRNQNISEIETKKDYEKTLRTLKTQITYMQEGTALIASYPDVMIDFPDSKGEESSLDCFNEAFTEVQITVNELDQEIIKAKKVYAMAKSMRDVAGNRSQKFDKSIFDGLTSGRTVFKKSGKTVNGHSDVTGTLENKKKNIAVLEGSQSPISSAIPSGKKSSLNSKSTITSSTDLLTGSFSNQLEERARARGQGTLVSLRKVKAKSAEADSIGSVLWRENAEVSNASGKFEMNEALSAESQRAPSALTEQISLERAVENKLETASNVRPFSVESLSNAEAASVTTLESPSSIGGRDRDLFALVKMRYRETELFRLAR